MLFTSSTLSGSGGDEPYLSRSSVSNPSIKEPPASLETILSRSSISSLSIDNRPSRSVLLENIRAVCHYPSDSSASDRVANDLKSVSSIKVIDSSDDPRAGNKNKSKFNSGKSQLLSLLSRYINHFHLDTLSQTISLYNCYHSGFDYFLILSAGPVCGLSVEPIHPESLKGSTLKSELLLNSEFADINSVRND
ncbi:uncharacterized protein RAG0_13971 [Rhynchosporium agropyri]|uniref:Uncharacterized protein n=1 Tax=Rhynchosporium agropyri TaxID=914238 RepID=A0A1E1LF12_9HELO|nr:uncharacterized protein RAG0_13971 [Rhynchosporium agropyri]